MIVARIDELPSALGRDFEAEVGDRRPALFLDFDGTLCPIVSHPELAVLNNETRQALRRVADRYPVAVVSGRDRLDVAGRVALDDVYYAGSHGCDISGPNGFQEQWGLEFVPSLEDAALELEKAVEIVMAELAKSPRTQPKRPAFPNYPRPGGPPTGDTANAVRK